MSVIVVTCYISQKDTFLINGFLKSLEYTVFLGSMKSIYEMRKLLAVCNKSIKGDHSGKKKNINVKKLESVIIRKITYML